MKFGLTQKVIEAINSVFSQYPGIEEVVIYGSRAKGNFREGSDIDLTIKASSLTTSDLLSIENKIDDLMLPYKVDLSLLHQITEPDLFEHISRAGITFFIGTQICP